MYKLKDVVKRGSALLGAAGLLVGVGASALPAFVSADALNPLTERSLTLSSSSPGWAYTDGSGNATYAYPGSGANGKKTGNTFSFRVSSAATVHALTFQYCTKSAGLCTAPGDDTGSPRTDDATHSDLNIVTGTDQSGSGGDDGTPALISSTDWAGIDGSNESDFATSGHHAGMPKANNSQGNFIVLTAPANDPLTNGQPDWSYPQYDDSGTPTDLSDWDMTANNQEESSTNPTGKNNMITLTSTTGMGLNPGDYVKIIFFATDDNYITNPGSGAFFVKINTYSDATYQNWDTDIPTTGHSSDVIDGGVTVANVMNESIAIQTKVLETMDFSVGTVDPDSMSNAQLAARTNPVSRGTCNAILPNLSSTDARDVLMLGDPDAEDSLSTDHTFATHSYWRLSSNSSNGATVYYSGVTLSNTEGDTIKPIGVTADQPRLGTEQFGLALDNTTSGNGYAVDYALGLDSAGDGSGTPLESGADTGAAGYTTTGGEDGSGLSQDWQTYQSTNSSGTHQPRLSPLEPTANYGGGTGGINSISGTNSEVVDTDFAFDPDSNTVPTPMATEDDQVVDCVTGKVRYIANIAATTPAGIYTTKINYIAAPQY